MMVIQISPSLLEGYRQSLEGLYGMNYEKLRDYITRAYKINRYSSRGWAYHKMIEDGPERYRQLKPVKGKVKTFYQIEDWRVKKTPWTEDFNPVWSFSEEAVEPIHYLRETYSQGEPEVWADWYTRSHGYEIRVRMRLDMLDGLTIHEFKTGKSKKHFKEYFPSVQWRLNLLAAGDATKVIYHHVQLGSKNNWARLESIPLDRSLFSESDVQAMIDGLILWILDPGNEDLLERLSKKGNTSPFDF